LGKVTLYQKSKVEIIQDEKASCFSVSTGNRSLIFSSTDRESWVQKIKEAIKTTSISEENLSDYSEIEDMNTPTELPKKDKSGYLEKQTGKKKSK